MTPREIFEYAVRKGLANRELYIVKNDSRFIHYIPVVKEDVSVTLMPKGNFVTISEDNQWD